MGFLFSITGLDRIQCPLDAVEAQKGTEVLQVQLFRNYSPYYHSSYHKTPSPHVNKSQGSNLVFLKTKEVQNCEDKNLAPSF